MSPQPKVRPPKAEAGEHTVTRSGRRVKCSAADGSCHLAPRWLRGKALCPACWHPLSEEQNGEAMQGIAFRLGSSVAVGQTHLADDWDDSTDGSIELAKHIEAVLPLRGLQREDRRKAIFQIAQLQHKVVGFDSPSPVPAIGSHPAGTSWETRAAWIDHYQTLINQATLDLVKDTIK